MFSTLDTKVLVITGRDDGSESFSDIKVLDLLDPDKKCQNLAPFAEGKTGATGALVHGVPIVCGGYRSGRLRECHTISNNSVTPLKTQLDTARSFATSIAVNNSLWVLGGTSRNPTSEYVQINGTMSSKKVCSGQDDELCKMPEEFDGDSEGMTLLEVEANTYLLVGGSSTFIKRGNQSWTAGPVLNETRWYHTAGLITDQITRKKSVVIAGGLKGLNALSSVELLSLPIGNSEWTKGIGVFSLCFFTLFF